MKARYVQNGLCVSNVWNTCSIFQYETNVCFGCIHIWNCMRFCQWYVMSKLTKYAIASVYLCRNLWWRGRGFRVKRKRFQFSWTSLIQKWKSFLHGAQEKREMEREKATEKEKSERKKTRERERRDTEWQPSQIAKISNIRAYFCLLHIFFN